MADHLIDHKYSVAEIDRMREAVDRLLFLPVVSRRMTFTCYPNPTDRCQMVETRLRTYMLAGIRPEKIEAEAEAANPARDVNSLLVDAIWGLAYVRSVPKVARDRNGRPGASHFWGRHVNDLERFAAELQELQTGMRGYRFRGADRYVVDVDVIRTALIDLVERMRAAASKARPDPQTTFRLPARGPVHRNIEDERGRRVRVEHRRRRARM